MRKSIFFLLLIAFNSTMLQAAENSSPGFFEMLRMKIEQLTPHKKLSTTTAVGGVRGAPVENTDVYWKGEAKPSAIDADELMAFRHAVTLVEAGKKQEARTAFDDFTKKFPDSMLRKDAESAIAQLKE